jgi:hypothetical protein
MTQWENLPEPVAPRPATPATPVTASWAGFSADPRIPANQSLRASDADRDFAAQLVRQAMAAGRIDAAEQDARALAVSGARTLGDLSTQVADLMVADAVRGVSARSRGRVTNALRGWAGLAVMLNAIWLMTVLTTGHLLYYWPMWPMAGTAIPLVMALFWQESPEEEARHRSERDAQDARRAARRAHRDQRRALRRGGVAALPPAQPPTLPPSDDLR